MYFGRGFLPSVAGSFLVLPELPAPSEKLDKPQLNGLLQARIDPLNLNGSHQVFVTGPFINWVISPDFVFPLNYFFQRKLQAVPNSLPIKFIMCCEPEECQETANALQEAGFHLTGNGQLIQHKCCHHLWFVLPAQDLPIIGEGIHQLNEW